MWLLYVGLYIVFSVIFSQFYKISTKKAKNHGELTVLIQGIAGLSILILIPLFDIKWPTNYLTYLFLLISCIFYAVNDRLNTTARSGLDVSTFSILGQLSTVFLILFGLLIFKEPFVLTKMIGALLITFGNVLIFYKKGKFNFNKYVLLGIIANIAFSIAMFIDVNLSSSFNLPIYISLELLIPALLIILFEKIKLKNIKEEFKIGNKLAIMLTGLSWGILIIFLLLAYQNGKVTVITPICALTVITNVIVSYIFLNERDNLLKKIIAAILIIISVILIKL